MKGPKDLVRAFVPTPLVLLYHRALAKLGSIIYRHPSRSILVMAVTGTKGKTSTVELINAIFEANGNKTALINSIRVKTGDESKPNPAGRSMPGRFFLQRFLAHARRSECTVAIIEMTSEGARQHRHRDIELDGLVFTNLSPEHIESHGSLKAYADAKFEIGKSLARSRKRPRIIVANADDPESARYLALPIEQSVPFSLSTLPHQATDHGGSFTFEGVEVHTVFPGEFSLRNALGAATLGLAFGISPGTIARGIKGLTRIPGRAERIECGQDFIVVVDYAHTPDSLQALCDAYGGKRKICILGSAGGGRDTWKRPVMGKIAEGSCDMVILTNDDPYDEDPRKIIGEIAAGMRTTPHITMDRREAIREGLRAARTGDVVLITGKGVDPIYGPGGSKTAWSDAEVAREELGRLADGILHV